MLYNCGFEQMFLLGSLNDPLYVKSSSVCGDKAFYALKVHTSKSKNDVLYLLCAIHGILIDFEAYDE